MRTRKLELGTRNLIGARVTQLRLARGMKQVELLAQLQLRGVDLSIPALSLLEGQRRPVSDIELYALAEILGVSADELLGRTSVEHGAFMDYYAIGQRVRKFRTSQHLSQEQLAEPVNISTTHMSHIETGNTKLSLQVFCDLASALHVSADDLLFDGRPSGKAVCTQEIANLLSRCSPSQAQVLKDLLFAAKQSMDSYMP